MLRILSANTTAASDQNHHPTLTDDQWTLYICVVVGLVLLAGLMSGLTLGLMSINVLDMEVMDVIGMSGQCHGAHQSYEAHPWSARRPGAAEDRHPKGEVVGEAH